jgi:hypothetical protein
VKPAPFAARIKATKMGGHSGWRSALFLVEKLR